MTTALDIELDPATYAHERTPLLAATIVALAVRECDTCGATGSLPCRTASGGVARREHRGRVC